MKKSLNVTHRFDDIINLPHHVSSTRPRMSLQDRAAQFSPFAALSGHGAAIRETARITDKQVDLTEDEIVILDDKLHIALDRIDERPEIDIVFFVPDEQKNGGAYVTATGCIKKVDEITKTLILENGTSIMLEHIIAINGRIFDQA